MTLFNKHKKTGSFGFASCKDMATAILANLPEEAQNSIEKVELSKIGKGPDEKSGFFLNIYIKQQFVLDRIQHIVRADVVKMEGLGQQADVVMTPPQQEEEKKSSTSGPTGGTFFINQNGFSQFSPSGWPTG